MTASMNNYINSLQPLVRDPIRTIRAVASAIRAQSNGELDSTDPTSPVIAAFETAIVTNAVNVAEVRTELRRTFPSLATSMSDLYDHLNDVNVLGRFALPGTVDITLVLNKDEVLAAMVNNNDSTYRYVCIPADTSVVVGGVTLGLTYPVIIRQLPHTGLQIVYDDSIDNPLHVLESNIVPFVSSTPPGTNNTYLMLTLKMHQYSIYTGNLAVNRVTGVRADVEFDDQFIMARAFMKQASGQWEEINISYSEQVYDPQKPTVIAKVLENSVQFIVPPSNIMRGQISGNVRFHVYATRGGFDFSLSDFAANTYKASWLNIDESVHADAVTAFRNLSMSSFLSLNTITGGRNGLTFQEMRERVLTGTIGNTTIPITPQQLKSALFDLGFDSARVIDSITDLDYVASKDMPTSSDSRVLTTASAVVLPLVCNIPALKTGHGVNVHGNAVTITPKAIFQTKNAITRALTTQEHNEIESLPNAERVSVLNANTYTFTPFHYVLDASREIFKTRAYYLDNPRILNRKFIQDNSQTELQVSIANAWVTKTSTGMTLSILTKSSKEFQLLSSDIITVQLSFVPQGETQRAYLQGVLYGTTDKQERQYDFDLRTNYYVDSDDHLELTSTHIPGSDLPQLVLLEQEFDVCFYAAIPGNNLAKTNIDAIANTVELSDDAIGVSRQSVTMLFGEALKNLWSRTRSTTSEVVYEVYDQDVLGYYDTDVLQKDPTSGSYITFIAGVPQLNVLHHKGDPIIVDGVHQVLHKKGTIKYDATGAAIVNLQATATRRIVEMFMLDGIYRFATDDIIKDYLQQMLKTVVTWVTQTIPTFEQKTQGITNLYFKPKVSQGSVSVITDKGAVINIAAQQSLVFDLFVPKITYANTALRQSIEAKTIALVDGLLKSSVVSVSAMVDACSAIYATDVIGCTITGFAQGLTNTVTHLDDTARLSIKKVLRVMEDGLLRVVEDVTFNWYTKQ